MPPIGPRPNPNGDGKHRSNGHANGRERRDKPQPRPTVKQLQEQDRAAAGSGLRPSEENRLVRMALASQDKKPERRFDLTDSVRRQMIDVSCRNMHDENGKTSNGAVANLIRMEQLNQADQHHAEGERISLVDDVRVEGMSRGEYFAKIIDKFQAAIGKVKAIEVKAAG